MKTILKHKELIENSVKFLSLKSANELSKLLMCYFPEFIGVIKNASYFEFKIPKKKKGYRTIESPNLQLRELQKRLNSFLQALYCIIKPEAAYGFVLSYQEDAKPHTIISNAKNHLNKKYVLNIDLKDFFHSISAIQVREFFKKHPYNFNDDLATCLALICCYKGRLPMGAPTSPVVSNLICIPLDKQLMAIAQEHKLTYTRYADDMTFSSNENISDEAITQIKASITAFGFQLNEKKFRMQSKFRQQTVTGIKVNAKTNVDRKYVRNIRATIHDIKLNGLEAATQKHYVLKEVDKKLMQSLLQKIEGKINFVGQVKGKDDGVYRGLLQQSKEVGMFRMGSGKRNPNVSIF
ncbi:MAG: reverse transcriptase family protein [Bacteroidota bacterium]